MYHLFNKIRSFHVGRIAQPSVFICLFSFFNLVHHLCRSPKLADTL